MPSLANLSEKIAACQSGEISLEDFEDWFSIATHNVFQWVSGDDIDLVASIEAVFSAYHFQNIEESSAIEKLIAAAVYEPARPSVIHARSDRFLPLAPTQNSHEWLCGSRSSQIVPRGGNRFRRMPVSSASVSSSRLASPTQFVLAQA